MEKRAIRWRGALSDGEKSNQMERRGEELSDREGVIQSRASWQPSCRLFLVEGFLVQVLRLIVEDSLGCQQ